MLSGVRGDDAVRGTGRRIVVRAALALLVALVAASCGGGDGASDESGGVASGKGTKGGTFRVQTDAFEWTGNFDPTGEYLSTFLGLYSNLLGRTLMGYKHVAGPEGNELIPDLAEDMPEISEDGLTYTFTLRQGVKF
ncbi:MAG: ABC transporter substrate-binding protein, partial [Actinomycetota bacterium]|nr:ABC transporter substrate-binding protein [Actinomycetota bacterium]